jgi:hypothetical protein
MESSDSGTGVADCSVGAIVWVRRRNGSWWPGKILGPEELSASHLMSPRSGTPVKLLGREDASVDWYNLEKSKRVKSFRCGEFDDCIERAEASQGAPPKKRDKYARREDAILHALELEKQLLEKKYSELTCSSNGTSSLRKDLATSSENNNTKTLKSHRNAKGPDSSYNNSDILPRMRGLQEIGPRTKRKPNGPKKKSTLVDNDVQSTESTVPINSKISMEKRKRSNEGIIDESQVKRRDRRRPLVQVLESSAKLSAQLSFHPDDADVSPTVSAGERKFEGNGKRSKRANFTDNEIHSEKMEIFPFNKFEESESPPLHLPVLSEENPSESTEDTETDSSETGSLDSDTDETVGSLSDDSAPIELIPKFISRAEAGGEEEHMSSEEEADEFTVANDQFPNSPLSGSVGDGVSKWQIKGKRNNRGVSKRVSATKNFSHGSSRRSTYKESEINDYDESGFVQNHPGVSRSIIDWDELAWTDEPTVKGYWPDNTEYYDPMFAAYGNRTHSMLMDVDLKVQSNYQREHVPMISLMSKLNGKAIIGHPIQVETLDNGFTDAFWPVPEIEEDEDTTLPSVWKTARRTANCRVPRPQGSRSTRVDRKYNRKPAKKMSVSSNPKIRALSSIGNKSFNQVDGLIKQESVGPTVVACIPVKLVFSRLHEALVGRHQ